MCKCDEPSKKGVDIDSHEIPPIFPTVKSLFDDADDDDNHDDKANFYILKFPPRKRSVVQPSFELGN